MLPPSPHWRALRLHRCFPHKRLTAAQRVLGGKERGGTHLARVIMGSRML